LSSFLFVVLIFFSFPQPFLSMQSWPIRSPKGDAERRRRHSLGDCGNENFAANWWEIAGEP
jgi:hypothetical protein